MKEVGQGFPTFKPTLTQPHYQQKSVWTPHELERRILKAVQADYREHDNKRHVETEIVELTEEAYPDQYT